MSQGNVIFEGTWAEAVRHAAEIPDAMQIRITEVDEAGTTDSEAQFRNTLEELFRQAEEQKPENRPSGGADSDPPDEYLEVLEEKFRRQGFRLE